MSLPHAQRPRLLRIAVAATATTLAFAAAVPLAGAADIPTQAKVASNATPPSVDCGWAMPDMTVANNDGMAYVNGIGASDDDFSKAPTPAFSCAIAPGADWPNQPNNVRHQIQVRANTLNEPTPRRVELWSAVSAETGLGSISSVYWKVFHPDGTFKAQIHAETLTNGVAQDYDHGVYAANSAPLAPSMPRKGDCYGPGGATPNVGTMFKGASTGVTAALRGNDELSTAAIDPTNQNSLITACNEQQKAFFYAGFDLHKEQPCGEYVVESHALVNGAEAPILRYTIDVECFYDLETDFTSVNWGTLVPGMKKVLPGDTRFSIGDGKPTVRNGGNAGMAIGVQYTPLVQSNADGVALPGGKLITWFDATFGRDANHLQDIPRIDSGIRPGVFGTASFFDSEPANGGQRYYQILCSDETGKLDLSVHPDANMPSGNYVGSVRVIARGNPGDRKGNGQVWVPGTNLWPRVDPAAVDANNSLVSTKLCWQDQDLIEPAFPAQN